MDEQTKKLEHLKMIQEIIVRMSNYGASIKNWGVTIVAALVAIAAAGDKHNVVWLAFLPVLSLWWLDGLFLQIEKHYRAYFEAVRTSDDDYNFKLSINSDITKPALFSCMFSGTLAVFWGGLCVAVVLCVVWVKCGG